MQTLSPCAQTGSGHEWRPICPSSPIQLVQWREGESITVAMEHNSQNEQYMSAALLTYEWSIPTIRGGAFVHLLYAKFPKVDVVIVRETMVVLLGKSRTMLIKNAAWPANVWSDNIHAKSGSCWAISTTLPSLNWRRQLFNRNGWTRWQTRRRMTITVRVLQENDVGKTLHDLSRRQYRGRRNTPRGSRWLSPIASDCRRASVFVIRGQH